MNAYRTDACIVAIVGTVGVAGGVSFTGGIGFTAPALAIVCVVSLITKDKLPVTTSPKVDLTETVLLTSSDYNISIPA